MSFDEDARARGWPVPSLKRRTLALHSGTLLAWIHGWRIDGIHEHHFVHLRVPEERVIHIEPTTRFTRISGRPLEVRLDPSIFEDPIEP